MSRQIAQHAVVALALIAAVSRRFRTALSRKVLKATRQTNRNTSKTIANTILPAGSSLGISTGEAPLILISFIDLACPVAQMRMQANGQEEMVLQSPDVSRLRRHGIVLNAICWYSFQFGTIVPEPERNNPLARKRKWPGRSRFCDRLFLCSSPGGIVGSLAET
jgi:hypothetical protein